jgi:Cof subfamily protein (haloacid dehalogenase superfamily)
MTATPEDFARRPATKDSILIKALFSDVDRTILTSDYRLPDAVIQKCKILGKQAQIILATARSPGGVRSLCETLGVEYAICFNGGWIGRPLEGTTIWETTLERSLALSIMKATQEAGVPTLWFGAGAIFSLNLNDVVQREARITNEDVIEVRNLEDLPGQPYKIMCSRPTTQETAFDSLRALFSSQCAVTGAHWRLLEFTPDTVSKGEAAARLAKRLGLAKSLCAAAGDAENDISLLKWAGLPVTVANAIPECIEIARYVGPHADDGGMADVMEWLGQRKSLESSATAESVFESVPRRPR